MKKNPEDWFAINFKMWPNCATVAFDQHDNRIGVRFLFNTTGMDQGESAILRGDYSDQKAIDKF